MLLPDAVGGSTASRARTSAAAAALTIGTPCAPRRTGRPASARTGAHIGPWSPGWRAPSAPATPAGRYRPRPVRCRRCAAADADAPAPPRTGPGGYGRCAAAPPRSPADPSSGRAAPRSTPPWHNRPGVPPADSRPTRQRTAGPPAPPAPGRPCPAPAAAADPCPPWTRPDCAPPPSAVRPTASPTPWPDPDACPDRSGTPPPARSAGSPAAPVSHAPTGHSHEDAEPEGDPADPAAPAAQYCAEARAPDCPRA